jgi:aconitase B
MASEPAIVDFSEALVRQIAMDVGKQVVDHIEHAYPAMCDAVAWNSARTSIRNCTHNAIMEAVKAANEGAIDPMLERHDDHRRTMRRLRKAAGQRTEGARCGR